MRRIAIILLALLICTAALAEETDMKYDFTVFTNVSLKGIDTSTLNEDELSALYQAARYCHAMTEADIDTMRQIVSEDMTFTHMSGMKQTREEYFADVADGRLTYYAIGMENPVVKVDGDMATVIPRSRQRTASSLSEPSKTQSFIETVFQNENGKRYSDISVTSQRFNRLSRYYIMNRVENQY